MLDVSDEGWRRCLGSRGNSQMAANGPEWVNLGWSESTACGVVLGKSLHLWTCFFQTKEVSQPPWS